MPLSNLKYSDSFRQATSIRSLKASSDNSFAQAKDLGTLKVGRSFSFKVKDAVGSGDSVDFFKFKIQPGVDAPSTNQISVKGGSIKVTVFGQLGSGQIQQAGVFTVQPGSPFFNDDNTFNAEATTATIYLKVTPTKGSNSTYKIKFAVNP